MQPYKCGCKYWTNPRVLKLKFYLNHKIITFSFLAQALGKAQKNLCYL